MRCEVIILDTFGHFECYYLGQVSVLIWVKFVLTYFYGGVKRLRTLNYHFCVCVGKQFSGNSLKILLLDFMGAKTVFFQISCFKLKS